MVRSAMVGSQAALPLRSGIWLRDIELALLNSDPPTIEDDGNAVPLAPTVLMMVPPPGIAGVAVLAANVVAGFSADRANHRVLSKSLTTRICGVRCQTKPGMY